MSSTKHYRIGVDVGGTKMTSILMEGDKVIDDLTLATPKDNLEHFMIMFKALVDPLLEKAHKEKGRVAAIGVGIPGMISEDKSKVLKCPNLPLLNGVKLTLALKQKFNYSILLDNDARCFVRAESVLGAGKNHANIYGVTIGTGIGGGWYVDGDVYSGANGGGGEPGHMVLDYQTFVDWEDAYHTLTGNDPAGLAEHAYRGDMKARETFQAVGKLFGAGFANIANIVGPEMIVIGGGVSNSSDLFLDTARKTMKELIVNPASKNTKVLKAKLGQLAGAIGASLLK